MIKEIVNQRFIECISVLISEKKVPSKSVLATKFNISNSKFSEILKGRMNVGVDILFFLVNDFNISSEWLLTGKGSMFKENTPTAPPPEDMGQIALLQQENAFLKEKIHLLEEKVLLLKQIQNLEKDKNK